MLRELFKRISTGSSTSMRSVSSEPLESTRTIKGEVFWELRDTATGEIQSKGHKDNVVTLDAGILIARLLRSTATPNVSDPKFGVFALAVGTGDVAWNPMSPPPGSNTQRSLFYEIGRKAVESVNYVAADGSISGIPTNVLDFNFTFSESEAVGPLVEMALIGGDCSTNMATRNPVLPANGAYDATVDLTGKDTLVNYTTFPVINKGPSGKLSWTWRLTI